VRGHDDEVTAFRHRGIDDRLVRMLMLDLHHFAWNARCLRHPAMAPRVFSACFCMRALY
jgi:hypothetical protein